MSQLTSPLHPTSPALPDGASTIASRIRKHAQVRPRHTAVVVPGFPPFSYEYLVRHIDLIGAALREAGLDRCSRIAILLPSGPELALAALTVACNAVAVPCNPALSEAEMQQLLARLNLAAVILPGWLDPPEWIGSIAGCVNVLHIAKVQLTLSEALIARGERRQKGDDASSDQAASDDPALILQTSGTVGPPKLVPVSHRNLMAMAARMEHYFEISHRDRCACLLPLYYAQGIKSACIVPLLLGGSIALPQAPALDRLEAWLSELQPTWFPAGPTFLQAFLDRVRAISAGTLNHNLRFIVSGSAGLPEQVRAAVESALGVPVLDAFGMTEIGQFTGNSVRPAERRAGTVGYVFPDEVAIAAADGRLCGAGETGELLVRGPAVFSGYIADEDTNRAAFAHGWFHTGDLGTIDNDGFLTITGRIKEIINRGGEKISPVVVERALLLHPSIGEAAAFGIPHARLGEDVAAAIVLRPDANVTGPELQTFLIGKLPHQTIPRSIFFLPTLPKGATGKVLRRELAESCRPAGDRVAALPENEIESQLAALWRRLLKRDDVGVEDDFFEAGGDSLLAAQMLLEAGRISGKPLRNRILPVPATIRAFARSIAAGAPQSDDALVVRIGEGQSGAPFFFCHGDYMFGGRYAYNLAELVGGDHAFYLLNNHHLSGRQDLPAIEELARDYLPAVLAAQPTGNFRLGGHCNGGLMAWELARQLSAAGREVEVVILIEPISLNARPGFRRAGRLLDALMTRRKLRADVMFLLWRTFRHLRERFGFNSPSEDAVSSWSPESQETRKIYQRLMANYVPPRIPARIICLTAAGSNLAVEFDWKPWRHLSPAVTARVVPGNHISCLTTQVASLAESLREGLCH